jgi:hypothetical protein
MIIALSKPLEWEGKTYTKIDLKLEGIKGKQAMAALSEVRRKSAGEQPIPMAMDERVHLVLAARCSGVPRDAIEALDVQDFMSVLMEVQNFLLGSVSEKIRADLFDKPASDSP